MAEIVFVTIPQETVNDESVRILSWKVPSGSAVKKDQVICEVETSKAVMEIEAPAAGTAFYTVPAGDEVAIGAIMCQIVPEGMTPVELTSGSPSAAPTSSAPAPSPATPAPTPTPAAAPTAQPQYDDGRPARLTPLAAKVAAEFGLDKSSFPSGTLVRRDDVLRKLGKLPPVSAAPPAVAKATRAAEEQPASNNPVPGVELVWTDLPRRKIFEARILRQGHASTVQSSVTSSVRVPRLRHHLEEIGLTGVGLGALVIFEAARLLRKYPEFNALHDAGRIGQYQAVNVGWAIDGGQGLMVPVIPAADQKTPAEIVEVMQRQIDAYVGETLSTADFLGGTFTVSDLSGDSISHFHPLISQGQAAILGIGGERNAAGDETLYLTLAFDHQIAEGHKAGQFVRELALRLEAHEPIDVVPEERPATFSDPFCAVCQRDAATLRGMKAILVKSEVPAGHVCSVCLGGFV